MSFVQFQIFRFYFALRQAYKEITLCTRSRMSTGMHEIHCKDPAPSDPAFLGGGSPPPNTMNSNRICPPPFHVGGATQGGNAFPDIAKK